MQRIQEEYGAIFEHLARNHARMSSGSSSATTPTGVQNGLVDLSPTALIHVGFASPSCLCRFSLTRAYRPLTPPLIPNLSTLASTLKYGNVDWINSMEFLGKNCRKGVEFNSICFVFRQFVVFLCKE